jgi:outer membrane scaffolding protein for murein synthesis (MipA/OmpV family)
MDERRGEIVNNRRLVRHTGFLLLIMLWCASRGAIAQTPSPLQEWQYSGGVILARLFEPNLPELRTTAGLGGDVQPVYDGARAFRVNGGPVLDLRYEDIAFFSTGEGLGYNFLRGDHYLAGLGMTYDLGRHERDDYTNLHGMGNIGAAPVAKLYGSVVLSKKFPLILRVDARQYIGGAQGAVGDVGVYIPLPGSSRRFVMFAGPSITVGTRHYLQTLYGVSEQQSLASGHPEYLIDHSGTAHAGVGFSATKFLGKHWLINLDAALSQIRGDPANSPIIERRTQRVLALSFDYHHE